jgi:hypothetical protein
VALNRAAQAATELDMEASFTAAVRRPVSDAAIMVQ